MELFEEDKRIARIFGKEKGEPPPDGTIENFKIYFDYLKKNLSFPFEAEYFIETGPFEDTYYDIKVTGLSPLEEVPHPYAKGLFCKGKQDGKTVHIPLWMIEVKKEGKNKRLINDYGYWYVEYRI